MTGLTVRLSGWGGIGVYVERPLGSLPLESRMKNWVVGGNGSVREEWDGVSGS